MKENDIIKDRYQLLRPLGAGGFGEVWLAKDQMTGSHCAIKFYVRLDDAGRSEFRSEYSRMLGIHDAHLLTASYYDEWQGRPFLVMDYCGGGAASGKVGQLSETELWRLIRDVASGLVCLHSQRNAEGKETPVIHQDIKPANFLQKDDGTWLISDFGISSRMRSSMSSQSGREVSSGGTIPYMGPERFGQDQDLVKASDIWALGASIYEMAKGKVPFGEFGGGTQRAGAEIPHLAKERWSPDLDRLVNSCLQKETWYRPTAELVAEYADCKLKGKPLPRLPKEARPPKPNPNPKPWKWIMATGAVVAAVLTIVFWPKPTPTDPDTEAFEACRTAADYRAYMRSYGTDALHYTDAKQKVDDYVADSTAKAQQTLIPVIIDDKWGYIDTTGKVVIQPNYDYAYTFSEDLAAVKIEEKYGYINKSGKVIVDPQFDYAGSFSEGLAYVRIGKKYGYIDSSGKIKVKPQFDSAYKFCEGMAVITVDGLTGFIDTTGKVVVQPIYSSAAAFHEGMARVRAGTNYGYVDKTGREVVAPIYHSAGDFSEGVAKVSIYDETEMRDDESWCEYQDRRFKSTYIDKTGNQVLPFYKDGFSFSEGVAIVKDGSACDVDNMKWVIIDHAGREISKLCSYFGEFELCNGSGEFHDGRAKAAYGLKQSYGWSVERWVYIDKSGMPICSDVEYYANRDFYQGLAEVGKRNDEDYKYGLIDKTGALVVDIKYKWLDYNNKGFIIGTNETQEGIFKVDVINLSGKVIYSYVEHRDNE